MGLSTVLIVDDHQGFRALASALLESEGFDVVGEVPDGSSALDAVRRLHPDFVLLDVQLPDMDGFAVAAKLAQEPDPPPVVLTSSRNSSDYGSRVAATHALGFIPKDELSGEALQALLATPA
jgi:DNA-binding NarL/FixJ family response regulator